MPVRTIALRNGVLLTAARRSFHSSRSLGVSNTRPHYNTGGSEDRLDVEKLLSKPTWSVSSLLPSTANAEESPSISSKQLHHLLRLSALPPPKDGVQETEMLKTLSSQLHFVKQIQDVDTEGVEPFRSLRDETEVGELESELGMTAMKEALALEEVVGKHHERIRRKRHPPAQNGEMWDVLDTAERKVGRYFVVAGGKDQ